MKITKNTTQNEQEQPKIPIRPKQSFQLSKKIQPDASASSTQPPSPLQTHTSAPGETHTSAPGETHTSSKNLQTKLLPSSPQTPSSMQPPTPSPLQQKQMPTQPRSSQQTIPPSFQPKEQTTKPSLNQSKEGQSSAVTTQPHKHKEKSKPVIPDQFDDEEEEIQNPKCICHCVKINSKSQEYFDVNGRIDAFNESKAAAMEKILFSQEDYEISKSIQKKINEKKQKEQKQIQEKPDEFFQLDPRSAVLQAYRLNKSRQHIREALLISLSLVEGRLNL